MYTNNGNVLEILVKDRPITEYVYKGSNYIEGRKNSDYVVRFRNNSALRKKIVVSVDGLNVISGNVNWNMGYVVEPWATCDIPGWRKDNKNGAKFKFSSVGKSYNQHNEHGDVANVGVIGVKVFHEKPQLPKQSPYIVKHVYHHHDYSWPYYNGWQNGNLIGLVGSNVNVSQTSDWSVGSADVVTASCSSGPIATSSLGALRSCTGMTKAAEPVEQSIGTTWGKNVEFETTEVNLEFYDAAADTLLIYYDTREGLEMRGVDMRKKTYRKPDAFPAYSGVRCPAPV